MYGCMLCVLSDLLRVQLYEPAPGMLRVIPSILIRRICVYGCMLCVFSDVMRVQLYDPVPCMLRV